jgi:STE24 endopeptidase
VKRGKGRHSSQVLAPSLLALGVAALGARLLAPREAPIEPENIDLRSYFSEEEITRGARFSRPQMRIGLARTAVQLGALAALVRANPSFRRGQPNPILAAAATGAGLTVALTVPSLPLAAIARRRAIAVGLATQSWGGWAADLVKATAIESALSGAGGGAVVAAMRRWPASWWLPAAAGSVGVSTLLAALAPVLLDPVFNSFTPLPEGETRFDVLALAEQAGVKVGEVYSVDASRRTTAANAYVTGLGPTKRVVLFDTLLDRYSRDEVRVVVAHELAHVRHRDVPRGVLYAALVAGPAALAIQRLSWRLSPARGTPGALPALALAAAFVMAPAGLLGNRLSRALERRADQYSLELSGAPEAFVSFEQAIALQNVADLDPPRWVTRLLSTHPSTGERIGAALAYAKQAGASPPPTQLPGSGPRTQAGS